MHLWIFFSPSIRIKWVPADPVFLTKTIKYLLRIYCNTTCDQLFFSLLLHVTLTFDSSLNICNLKIMITFVSYLHFLGGYTMCICLTIDTRSTHFLYFLICIDIQLPVLTNCFRKWRIMKEMYLLYKTNKFVNLLFCLIYPTLLQLSSA